MSSSLRQRPFLAVYCLVRQGNSILVMQRKNTGYADGQWSVPAGNVDEGESVTAAGSRELLEETGLVVAQDDWRVCCAMHRSTPERESMDMFVVARGFSGIPENREPHKCAGLEFRPLDALPDPFLAYVETAIRAIERTGWSETVYIEDGWKLPFNG